MNPQLRSRSGRSGHLPSAFTQGNLNRLFLPGSKRVRELKRAFWLSGKRLPRKPTLVHGEIVCFAYNDGTLNDVLQFTNITWPRISNTRPRPVAAVSYQCHMNCDEWRQKVNKDRKE